MEVESKWESLVRLLGHLSLIFAFLSIPAIILQSSSSEQTSRVGHFGSLVIWIFFVVEMIILLRLTPDNRAWLQSHKLEVVVVIFASPVFTFVAERESFFAIVPLVVVARILRFLRFAKVAKLLKLGKINKIFRKSKVLPVWFPFVVSAVCVLVATAVLGMIIDHEAHSIVDGYTFWLHGFNNFVHDHWPVLGATLLVLAASVTMVRSGKATTVGVEGLNDFKDELQGVHGLSGEAEVPATEVSEHKRGE